MPNEQVSEIIGCLRTLEKWRGDEPVSDSAYVTAINYAFSNQMKISYTDIRAIVKLGV